MTDHNKSVIIKPGNIIQLHNNLYKIKDSVQIIESICWHDGPTYIDGYAIIPVNQIYNTNKYSINEDGLCETHSLEYLLQNAILIANN